MSRIAEAKLVRVTPPCDCHKTLTHVVSATIRTFGKEAELYLTPQEALDFASQIKQHAKTARRLNGGGP
jgi:hypothetical protein